MAEKGEGRREKAEGGRQEADGRRQTAGGRRQERGNRKIPSRACQQAAGVLPDAASYP
ncbi:MAG TPA: hypothetical protein VGL91_13365 [Acidobacteriota bacterium]